MSWLATVIPLLVWVIGFVANAVVFVALNGPLIQPVLAKLGQEPYVHLLDANLAYIWRLLLSDSRSYLAATALVLAFVAIGFTLNAFAQMLAYLAGWVANRICDWCKWHVKFFVGGQSFLDPGYVRFSVWISEDKARKSQWEWEMFNHYLYWGVSFSGLVHSSSAWLISGAFPWFPALLTTVLIAYCLMRGRTLLNFLEWGIQSSESPVSTSKAKPLGKPETSSKSKPVSKAVPSV